MTVDSDSEPASTGQQEGSTAVGLDASSDSDVALEVESTELEVHLLKTTWALNG